MFRHVIHRAARPFVRAWITESALSWRSLPVPADTPLAHAAGSDPDRVLLIGSGPTVSYGVASHNLGLAGHLARALAGLTGRGASVRIVASGDITVPGATATIRDFDLERFGAIVSTLGGMEALTFFPTAQWRAQLDEFIGASTVPVFVVGVAPISSIIRMPRLFGRIASRHGRLINEQSEAACAATEHATFVPFFPTPGDAVSLAGRATYAQWAGLIAPSVAAGLRMRPVRAHPLDHAREGARIASLAAMDLGTSSDDELHSIVETVRDLFGTSGAGLNLIGQERQWALASVGISEHERPRDEAFCNQTIARGELFVVHDTAEHSGEPWAQDKSIRFYAGYPIESPDGYRIGALCIVDSKPRAFDTADRALLRDLALHTQSVIWQRQIRQ